MARRKITKSDVDTAYEMAAKAKETMLLYNNRSYAFIFNVKSKTKKVR